jgi:hypothetical protein
MTGFVRTMARRWYLTVVGLLLTVAICLIGSAVVKPTYEATASILLLPPATSVGAGGNPYLQLGGLTQVVDVLSRALATRDMSSRITAADPKGEYTAAADVTTRGPILLLTATAPTSAGSLLVLDTLIRQAPTTLTGLQTDLNIAARSQITSMVLIRDSEATPIQKTRIRVLVAIAALGVVLTAFGIALLDALLTRRAGQGHGVQRRVADDDRVLDYRSPQITSREHAVTIDSRDLPPAETVEAQSSADAVAQTSTRSRRGPRMRPAVTPVSATSPARATLRGPAADTGTAVPRPDPDQSPTESPASGTPKAGARSGLRLP